MRFSANILTSPLLAQVASAVYTGFNYGAFWGQPNQGKNKADFLDGFTLARNLSTSISFNSARLFTCVQFNTDGLSTEAFDAAVESKTKLLLGFWISGGASPDLLVRKEMAALEKGFQKHGQTLSDLVIGLSVGSEDIYRWNNNGATTGPPGVSAEVVSTTVTNVKKLIATSSFAKFMKNKPIGHVDTAQYATQVQGADFVGMTAYPWWNKQSIDLAKDSFLNTVEQVKQAAGDTPVWIAEMGWPFHSALTAYPEAGAPSMQKYWTDVGCSVLGKYTTFWFQLLKDSEADQPDWGILDSQTRRPRFRDLSCPDAYPSASRSVGHSSQASLPTTLGPSSTHAHPSSSLLSSALPSSAPPATTSQITTNSTSTTTKTRYTTPLLPVSSNGSVVYTTKTAYSTVTVTTVVLSLSSTTVHRTWCVTEADVYRNGSPVTVAGGPVGADGKCSSPAPYLGHPYVTLGASVSPTAVPKNSTWCVTVADIGWNGKRLPIDANPAGADGKCNPAKTYNGLPDANRSSSAGPHSSAIFSSSHLPPAPVSTPVAPPLASPSFMPPSSPPPPSSNPPKSRGEK
ncbi:hypothetical protein NX059_000260 [Plenodomus lindquistii]|nr:hypothetical protein NX059_000260 [Plenodomus lindquistii]